jgi:GDP-L-fucose synthase
LRGEAVTLLQKTDRIFVPGYKGLVGSAITEALQKKGYSNLLLKDREDIDFRDQAAVRDLFRSERPDVVFLAAAKVGGIGANDTYRADFIQQNLQIQTNVISAAHEFDTHRLIFLGSSCIYPREAPQPMSEACLLSGPMERTNRPYAIAKIAGLEFIDSLRRQYGQDYFSVMPTNLYGLRDNYHPTNSHVMPALIRRFFEAKGGGADKVVIWGSGKPLREFLFAPDCADAIVFLAENLTSEMLDASPIGKAGWSHVNVGSGQEISIADLASMIARLTGFDGKIEFDTSKPDGTPRKLLDSGYLRSLGWSPKTGLEDGISQAIRWFSDHKG